MSYQLTELEVDHCVSKAVRHTCLHHPSVTERLGHCARQKHRRTFVVDMNKTNRGPSFLVANYLRPNSNV